MKIEMKTKGQVQMQKNDKENKKPKCKDNEIEQNRQ